VPDSVAAIVIQARTIAGQDAAFADWQRRMSATVAAAAGFVDLKVTPPDGTDRTDWFIIERFSSQRRSRIG
jgi:antibiotic biosynthesis monooxygenase (ABM) superfamily enzyme